jgi:hypothetical protein
MLSVKKSSILFPGIIILFGLLRFINLGGFDLQEWDESLYAVRAKSIVYYNDWVDQTGHSVEGLYSSSHPPLYSWLTAISYNLLGISEFSTRLVSAIAAIGILLLIYLISNIFYEKRIGFLSAIFLGLNPFFSFWSRQGQFDILLIFFITLSFYFYLYNLKLSGDTNTTFKSLIYDALGGIAFGMALMSKLFVGIIIPISIIIYELACYKKINLKKIFIISFFAILVALPWHLYMIINHGNGDLLFFLKQSAFVERTFTGIEGNTKELGIFYYLNQMIIYFPYLFIFAFYGFYKLLTKNSPEKIFFWWFFLYFFIITLISTKLSVYILPLCIPLVIIGTKTFDEMFRPGYSKKITWYILCLTIFCLVWSLDISFRMDLKKLFSPNFLNSMMYIFYHYYWIIFLFVFLQILVFYMIKGKFLSLPRYEYVITSIIFSLFVLSLYHFIILEPVKYTDGIKEITGYIEINPPKTVYSIGNGVNPQISFYLNGIDIGWNNNIKFIRLEPEKGLHNIYNCLDTVKNYEFYVLVEKEEILLGRFINYSQIIPEGFQNLLETKGYSLFKRSIEFKKP